MDNGPKRDTLGTWQKLNNEKQRDMKNETKKDVVVPQKTMDETGQRDAEVRQNAGEKERQTNRKYEAKKNAVVMQKASEHRNATVETKGDNVVTRNVEHKE